MEKEMFCFKKSWRDALEGLPTRVKMEVGWAIIEYCLNGRLVDLKPMANIVFGFIKRDIDHDLSPTLSQTEGDRRSITSRENGKKGGRKPKKESQEANQKPKEPNSEPKKPNPDLGLFDPSPPSPSRARVKGVNNQEDNNQELKDKKIEEKKESGEKETKRKNSAGNATASNATADGHKGRTLQSRREEFEKSLEPFAATYGREMVQKFFSYWSEANKSQTKMRWEMQKTWETPRRLAYWASRENSFNGRNYGNTTNNEKYDPRRGVEATYHTAEEYEEEF